MNVRSSLFRGWFSWRRPELDDRVLAALEPDETVTAWATAANGDVLVATVRGLWLPDDTSPTREPQRLSWHEIHKAVWADELLTITPGQEVEPGVVADTDPIRCHLPQPRTLPVEVRQRVSRSVAYSTHHVLPGGGVWVVARRVPGVDGLTWLLRFDQGTDRADPGVRERAAELLAQDRDRIEPI